jgi:ferredoxin
MAYVVTRLCIDCVDTACMVPCPVNCFYVPKTPAEGRPHQLYISADECINCDACVPECPWEAIFDESDVPTLFADDTALNALCDKERDLFNPAEHLDEPQPDADQVAANKKKWGLEG